MAWLNIQSLKAFHKDPHYYALAPLLVFCCEVIGSVWEMIGLVCVGDDRVGLCRGGGG